MKRFASILTMTSLVLTMVPHAMAEAPAEKYIPAPYTIENPELGPTEYLAPVFYQNENGPTIGVTLTGVIEKDGQYFKDSNNNQKLDVFEDWREDTAARVADLISQLTPQQRIGLTFNQMRMSSVVTKEADILDENGNIQLGKIINLTEDPFNAAYAGGATGAILGFENRSGVTRNQTDFATGAMFNNALNQTAEFGAVVKGEPAIPFFLISNPQNAMGLPGSNGVAAAVMGDVANGGDYSLVQDYAELDRKIWYAKGIDGMYGPQIDLITDARWPRDSGTYTEVPEVNAGIATALVKGYKDGEGVGSVSLTVKHFPGDGASYNGFESHGKLGEWRLYPTPGSLEKYQLTGFQAAFDAGATGIMPGYSRPADDARSAVQVVGGVEIAVEEVANAYNKTMLQTLLRDVMGFQGYVNSDSGITVGKEYGMEEFGTVERAAAAINAGCDTMIGNTGGDYADLMAAYEQGLIEEEALNRANTNRLTTFFEQGQFENPYKDVDAMRALGVELADSIVATGKDMNLKSVVLMKNHEATLPMTDTTKKVYVASFTVNGEDDNTLDAYKELFTAAGFEVTNKAANADIAFLCVVPGGVKQGSTYMNTVDLIDSVEVPEYDKNNATIKTGGTLTLTTLSEVVKIAEIAETVHGNGGKVVASINISNPWVLTNLEPYCDALIGAFSTSAAAQVAVMTGAYNPTGKLPVTMPACNEVLAVVDTEIEGIVYEICVSPNDVPGYDKDQYMSAEVLAQSPSGSYAYVDADGNLYKAWFGLSY